MDALAEMNVEASIVKENVMKMVEANVGKMEAKLRQWGARIDKLVVKAEAVGTEVKIDYRKDIDDLKGKYKVAQSKFDEFKAAGSAKWEIFKTGLETVWNDLENAFKKLGKYTVAVAGAEPSKTDDHAVVEQKNAP